MIDPHPAFKPGIPVSSDQATSDPPQALRTASPAARIFKLAFKSRSIYNPQDVHSYVRTDNGMSCLHPQKEHILLEGKNLSIATKCFPYQAHLYLRKLRNIPHPTSAIARDKCLFCTIPLMFKSSTTITSWFLTSLFDS